MDAQILKFTLDAPITRKKDKGIHVEMKPTLNEIFEGVITALRIFKSGGVDFYFTQQTPLMWDPFGGIGYQFKQRGDYFGHGAYNLKQDEIEGFVSFWKEFRDIIVKEEFQGHDYIRIVLKRFNLGLEEQDLENKFIDFFVAFEALFLPETSELSYRLSLRTATLLGNLHQKKKLIFNFMKDAYNLRSKIVHGKTPKIGKKRVDLKDYVSELENYLRKSIIRFLRMTNQFKNQETILRNLDQQILR